jgi:tetratricopeptide (TPR) repeat protein
VLRIREAVIDCIGRQLGPSGLARAASWIASVADTPATAIRFVDGVQGYLLENPKADEGSLYCAGLAAVVDWMLIGVDPRVVQWLLTLAIRGAEPERRISTDAALLGRVEALRRAFDHGLLYQVPKQEGDPLDLRRPLEALGRLESAPGRPTLTRLAEHLGPRLPPAAREVLDRLGQPPARRLGLPGPAAVQLIGRDEILRRLTVLLEPSDRIQTCVLYGVAGCGKTAVAATFARRMEHRLEPVWISFAGGPLAGWIRVAAAMELDTQKLRAEVRDKAGVPRWVRETQAKLAEGTYLLVVDDADAVEDELLPEWLPARQGRCAVLVLSRATQRALQRAHDAIALHVPMLSLEDAQQLLEMRVPHLAPEIAQGRTNSLIERVGRHPGALMLLSNTLANRGIEGTTESLSSSPQEVDVVPRVLREVVEQLTHDERRILRAVWICAPAGTRSELVIDVSAVRKGASLVDRLVDQGLLIQSGRTIRLEALVRLCLDQLISDEPSDSVLIRHALTVSKLMGDAFRKRDPVAQGDLYHDLFLASERVIRVARQGQVDAVDACFQVGDALSEFLLGSRRENLRRAIAAYQACLKIWTRESHPEDWAKVQNHLGEALRQLPTGNWEENLRHAIAAYQAALEIWTRESHPEEWAGVQNNLGIVFGQLPTGNHEENLRRAIMSYQAALGVWTRESHPEGWAIVQNNLGIAFSELPTGSREQNLRQAIAAYQAALEVWTPESHPEEWALAQNNLGTAFRLLPTGNQEENIRRAIMSYQTALKVWARESHPEDWAMAQNNLGIALSELTDSREENLQRTIAAFQGALEVWTRDSHPEEWAMVQYNLGIALRELPTGKREENLLQSINAYRAALEVWTRESHPEEWALVQNNLGITLSELPTGSREENLRRAITAFQAALEVWTREASSEEWALVQYNLGVAFSQLSTGSREENLRRAITAFQAALEAWTREAHPDDWAMAQSRLEKVLRELATHAPN